MKVLVELSISMDGIEDESLESKIGCIETLIDYGAEACAASAHVKIVKFLPEDEDC